MEKFDKPSEFKIPEGLVYCDVCTYPLAAGECPTCKERAAADALARRKQFEWDTKRLGGKRAYDEFKLEGMALTEANAAACAAAKKFNPFKDNMYLHGGPGAGKTRIATAIARRFTRGVVMKSTEILRESRRGVGRKTEDEFAAVDRMARVGVLVIDDLGVDKDTDFAFSVFYNLIDKRWIQKRNGLIVTSNNSLDRLAENYGDDRITSRLAGLCKGHVFDLGGETDYRIKNEA